MSINKPSEVYLKDIAYVQSRNILSADASTNTVTVESSDIFSEGDIVYIGDETITIQATIDTITNDDITFVEDLTTEQLVGGVIRRDTAKKCIYSLDTTTRNVYIAIEANAGEYYSLSATNRRINFNADTTGTATTHSVIIYKLTYTPEQTTYPHTEEIYLDITVGINVVTKHLNFIKENWALKGVEITKYTHNRNSLAKLLDHVPSLDGLYNVVYNANSVWDTLTLDTFTENTAYQYTISQVTLDASAETFLSIYTTFAPIFFIDEYEYRGTYVEYQTIEDIMNYIQQHQKHFLLFYNETDCYIYIPLDKYNLNSILIYGR